MVNKSRLRLVELTIIANFKISHLFSEELIVRHTSYTQLSAANRIIISCAGDNELAHDLHDYLVRNLKGTKSNVDDFTTLTVDEIEIVDYLGEIPRENIRSLLQSFLDLRSERAEEHTITELENIFTIGVKTDLLKEMKLCEFCGYISKDYHDMYQHRLRCAFVARLGI